MRKEKRLRTHRRAHFAASPSKPSGVQAIRTLNLTGRPPVRGPRQRRNAGQIRPDRMGGEALVLLALPRNLHSDLELRPASSEERAAGGGGIRVVPADRYPDVTVVGNAVVGGVDSEPANLGQQELRPRVAGPPASAHPPPLRDGGIRTRSGWVSPKSGRAQSSHEYSPGTRRAGSRECSPWASPPRCSPACR